MQLLLSKKEIEILNDEYKNKSNNYASKENVIIQMFTVKMYNLMKEDYTLASNYINKSFDISSICEDNILKDYKISDSKIFFTMVNDILLGFKFDFNNDSNTGFYSNIVRIGNDLFYTNDNPAILNKNKTITQHPSLKKLIKSSNLHYLEYTSNTMKSIMTNTLSEVLEERFLYNMFVEYQFRKSEFLKSPLTNQEETTLKKFYKREKAKDISNEPYAEKYIINTLKSCIVKDMTSYIEDVINNLTITMSKNLLNEDYLYGMLIYHLDELIIDGINLPIFNSETRKAPMILLDLLIIKDDIFNDIKKNNPKELERKTKIKETNDIVDNDIVNNDIVDKGIVAEAKEIFKYFLFETLTGLTIQLIIIIGIGGILFYL